MNIYLTSDHHFHHEKFLTFTGEGSHRVRPFSSIEELDELMVENWNMMVKPGDKVYHLGDLTMGRTGGQAEAFIKWMGRLNGTKRLILGNHDHFKMRVYTECGFSEIRASYLLEKCLALTHIPIHPGSLGPAVANVHGHTHEKRMSKTIRVDRMGGHYGEELFEESISVEDSRYINVCVEQWNYTPVSLDVVMELARQLHA